MTNQEEISILKTWRVTGDKEHEAVDMAISALEKQEAKQEVKKSRCTYKPDCPWYDGSKCNSPNDHGYHECDYDRGIFPESYEEEIKNSNESSLTQKGLDTISRQAAIDAAIKADMENNSNVLSEKRARVIDRHISAVPSAQPETAKRIVGKSRNGMTLWYQCDMCNEPVDAQDNFCRGCGRRLNDG